MNIIVDRKVIEQALEALCHARSRLEHAAAEEDCDVAIEALRTALEQPQPVQVSPLDFTHMVIDKEDMVGKPIFWAEWPNKE